MARHGVLPCASASNASTHSGSYASASANACVQPVRIVSSSLSSAGGASGLGCESDNGERAAPARTWGTAASKYSVMFSTGSAIGTASSGTVSAYSEEDSLSAGLERNLAETSHRILPQPDYRRRVPPMRSRALYHAVRSQRDDS